MALKVMGKKRGMVRLFDKAGNTLGCTVIEVEPNVVVQIKNLEKDGYCALQLGADEIVTKDPRTKEKRIGKPRFGHFKKVNLEPRRHLNESRLESSEGYEVGQPVTVSVFKDVPFVDVTAMTKGKGYQGVMKRHGFAGGPASHGSGFHRHAGSRGQRTSPGRVFPNGKAAGHMGHEQQTTQSLKVIHVDEEARLLVVHGAVPGPKNGLVILSNAVKKQTVAKKG